MFVDSSNIIMSVHEHLFLLYSNSTYIVHGIYVYTYIGLLGNTTSRLIWVVKQCIKSSAYIVCTEFIVGSSCTYIYCYDDSIRFVCTDTAVLIEVTMYTATPAALSIHRMVLLSTDWFNTYSLMYHVITTGNISTRSVNY